MSAKNYEVLAADKHCKDFFDWFEMLLGYSLKDLKPMTVTPKADNNDGFTEQANTQTFFEYLYTQDREFPLDTVQIKEFERKYDTELQTPHIHYGAQADEITRAMHVIALVIGTDIYFRNGAYKPESEEGRALLAHEMPHVAQYSEKRIQKHTDTKELENEAVYAEKNEYYESDPVITKVIQGVPFRIRKSKEAWLHNMIKEKLETLIEQYCAMQRDDKKKLKLLTTYMDLQKNGGFEAWLK